MQTATQGAENMLPGTPKTERLSGGAPGPVGEAPTGYSLPVET